MRFYISLFAAILWLKSAGQNNEHSVEILSSSFNIQVKTNVSHFHCKLFKNGPQDQLNVTSYWKDYNLTFNGLRFGYRVADFDCRLEAMNHDLQHLLKSDKHPRVYLEIHNILVDRSNREIEQLKVTAMVTITLSGVKQTYVVEEGMVINRSEEDLTFAGSKTLKMSDFNIEPPTRFFGLVKVTDELKVSFAIDMHVETLN